MTEAYEAASMDVLKVTWGAFSFLIVYYKTSDVGQASSIKHILCITNKNIQGTVVNAYRLSGNGSTGWRRETAGKSVRK